MKKLFSAIFLVIFGLLILTAFEDEEYFKITRSFEIFGEFYRTIINDYIVEPDKDVLLEAAIAGMLETLDPYTEYYPQKEQKEVELITEGTYTGFGITIDRLDNEIVISNILENFPAYNAGVRIGDKIFSIDDNIVINIDSEDLNQYTNGEVGSIANLKIIRGKDTLTKTLLREKIDVPDISYSELLNNNIIYIKLESFTQKTYHEVRAELSKLSKNIQLTGIIIDLRGNPGGLMEAAVNVAGLFVNRNSLIVTTKERNNTNPINYPTKFDPEYPNTPLVILINGGSASSSEILAGALQDLDRAVILGTRSFGKGLVQSFYQLPFNTQIKMTRARYYLPSGRSIQKRDIAELHFKKDELTHDSTIFKTKNGRKVIESHGVLPDSIIADRIWSQVAKDMYSKQLFSKFANRYTAKKKDIDANFEVDDNLFKKFLIYIDSLDYTYKTDELEHIEKIKEKIKDKGYSKDIDYDLTKLENIFKWKSKNLFDENKKEIAYLLENEIFIRFYPGSQRYKKYFKDDNVILSAQNILEKKLYSKILNRK